MLAPFLEPVGVEPTCSKTFQNMLPPCLKSTGVEPTCLKQIPNARYLGLAVSNSYVRTLILISSFAVMLPNTC